MPETLKPFVAKLVEMLRGLEQLDASFHAIAADWLEERGDPRAEDLRRLHMEQVGDNGKGGQAWAVRPFNGLENVFANAETAARLVISHALELLSATCPACKGRPFKITVRVEPIGKHTTITVEAWDLKAGEGVGINDGKVGRFATGSIPEDVQELLAGPSVYLGRIVGDPIPCETCGGYGVVEKWPARTATEAANATSE